MKIKKTQRRRGANRQLLALAVCIAMPALLAAQNVNSLVDDFSNRQKSSQAAVTAAGTEFGDSTDVKTGQTSFRHVDVVIPSNGQLSLTVSRRLNIAENRLGIPDNPAADGPLMGNWELELPHLSGFFDEGTGWVASQANPLQRCTPSGTGSMAPPTISQTFFGAVHRYAADAYWSGINLVLPGRSPSLLLQLLTNADKPADGAAYPWGTRENDRISCVEQLKNGPGQGFRLKTQDGLTYTFDWMASRRAMDLEDSKCNGIIAAPTTQVTGLVVMGSGRNMTNDPKNPPVAASFPTHMMDAPNRPTTDGGGSQSCEKKTVVRLREQMIFATRVEDRFGNWIAYDFDPANPRRVTAIRNSDGSAVRFTYNAQGKVESITDGTRTWRYIYAGTGATELAAVVQPDATQWAFTYPNIAQLLHPREGKVRWFDCVPTVAPRTASVTMTHPMGATAEFGFTRTLHGTDRVPGLCVVPNPDFPLRVDMTGTPMVYRVGSLTSKRISGVATPSAEWAYSYQPSWSWNDGGSSDLCTGPTCAGGRAITEIRRPDGTVERFTFGNDYWRNTGQLLSKAVIANGNTVREERYEYLASAEGQNFPDIYGMDLLMGVNNPLVTEKIRPLVKTTITQDGTTFVTETPMCGTTARCIDRFARSTRVERSNSAGHFKSEETQFHDDLNDWVLGNVASVRDPARNLVIEETEFDERALPVMTRKFGQLTGRYRYNADGTLQAATDALGNSVTLSEWRRGLPGRTQLPVTAESPNGALTLQQIDALGRVTAATNAVGGTTAFEYDSMGRVVRMTPPGGDPVAALPTVYAYHRLTETDWRPAGISAGQWRVYEGTGNRAKFTYLDALQRPVLVQEYDTADVAKTIRYTRTEYDALGRTVFTSNPERSASATTTGTRWRFDALGRQVQVLVDSELGSPSISRTDYLADLTVRVTDANGNRTLTEYMAWDNPIYDLPIYQALPEGGVTTIDRDPYFGRALAYSRQGAGAAESLVRRHVYDQSGRLCKVIEPEAGATVYDHDANGNVVFTASGLRGGNYADPSVCSQAEARSSGRGERTTYDALGRKMATITADGRGNQLRTYTPDGLIASIQTENGGADTRPVVNTYTYNRARRLVGESIGQPGWFTWSLSHELDGLGNVTRTRYPTGLQVDFAPNALGQPTQASGYATGVEYHPDGSVKRFVYGNGLVFQREINARGLPASISTTGVLSLGYQYDPAGNVTRIGDGVRGSGFDRSMTYDKQSRLTAMQTGTPGSSPPYQVTYDALDNILSKSVPGHAGAARLQYDGNNLLQRVVNTSGATVLDFAWDAQGNAMRRGDQELRYSLDNRLREIVGKVSYSYDGHGNRVQANHADGTRTLWMFDVGARPVFYSDWTQDGTQQANQKIYNNIYLGRILVASTDTAWPSNTPLGVRYHHPDHLGSPVVVTNQSGAVISRQEFGSYGETNVANLASSTGYTGHVADKSTDLVNMGARFYDPIAGRFLSVDPVRYPSDRLIGLNRYQYAANNPYRFVDPDGRQEAEAGGFFAGIQGTFNIPGFGKVTYGTNQVSGQPRHMYRDIQGPSAAIKAGPLTIAEAKTAAEYTTWQGSVLYGKRTSVRTPWSARVLGKKWEYHDGKGPAGDKPDRGTTVFVAPFLGGLLPVEIKVGYREPMQPTAPPPEPTPQPVFNDGVGDWTLNGGNQPVDRN